MTAKKAMPSAKKEDPACDLLSILSKAQEDVAYGRTSPIEETMDNIRKELKSSKRHQL